MYPALWAAAKPGLRRPCKNLGSGCESGAAVEVDGPSDLGSGCETGAVVEVAKIYEPCNLGSGCEKVTVVEVAKMY